AIIGKWHLGSDPQGFDHWRILPGQGDYYNPVFITPEGRVQVEGHCTDLVTDMAIEWLEESHDPDRPFMLMMQHKAPHRNWMPAPRHLAHYANAVIPEPPTLFDTWDDNASTVRTAEMSIRDHMNLDYDLFVRAPARPEFDTYPARDTSGQRNLLAMTEEQRATWNAFFDEDNARFEAMHLEGDALVRWKYQRYMKNYLGAIRGVDDSVGTMLAYLDRAGLADDTVVIYSSDQGFFLGDHGWFDKRWMYEESLRMPLIVRWPGVTTPGTRTRLMVQNLDYAQTLLEIAGLAKGDGMQGRSLVPLLKGEHPDDWRDAIYYHYHAHPAIHNVPRHCGVRTERYKLIQFYQTDEWEFYDLEHDPDEIINAYDDP
ncbi:MAG: DUF4976 domain-containing protein, partial [Phycisphaerales bacterium]|nr:DUF4976 domain-containing protein [Phycisphaerales bacterium]